MRSNKLPLAIIAFVIIAAADPVDAICQTPAIQSVEGEPVIGRQEVSRVMAGFHFNDPMFSASRFALFVTTVADLGTTWHGIERGGHELNPILGQSRAQQAMVVGGSVAALTIMSERLYESGHRKFAWIVNVAASGAHGLAAWHNAAMKF